MPVFVLCQAQYRGCCYAVCMGAAPEGTVCENALYTDDWFHTTRVPGTDATLEVPEELEAQDRHITAESVEAGAIFATPVAEEHDDHDFYLAKAMSSIRYADETMTDHAGNVIYEGTYYVPCHFLEWKTQQQGIYTVDYAAAVTYQGSHQVCIAPVQMTKVVGGWKLPDDELERVMHATAV